MYVETKTYFARCDDCSRDCNCNALMSQECCSKCIMLLHKYFKASLSVIISQDEILRFRIS